MGNCTEGICIIAEAFAVKEVGKREAAPDFVSARRPENARTASLNLGSFDQTSVEKAVKSVSATKAGKVKFSDDFN